MRGKVELKKQIKMTIKDTVFIIQHKFAGGKTIAQLYEEFLKRKLQYA